MEYLKQKQLITNAQGNDAVSETVSKIIEDIKQKGDSAVRYYSEKFDGWSPENFALSQSKVEEILGTVSQKDKEVIDIAQKQVRIFAEAQMAHISDFEIETEPGVLLGQKTIPIQASGSYIPGGRYPLVASAHMSIIPPKVAGVSRVVAVTPPMKGEIYPASVYAMIQAGASEIYCLGGVQAIAAIALGTETIKPVDIVVGAGNAYVAEAKRQLFGIVGIDQLAGPTEILVIADETADPEIVAADLVGQAEHDPNAHAILVTTSREFGQQVLMEVERQLLIIPTREVATASWLAKGEIIVVRDRDEAVEVSDQYAPEHLEIQTADDDWYAQILKNYGSLFIGEHSTVAYGDKVIGTNHILPTGRAARYTGGLWVGKFLKTVTYQKMNLDGTLRMGQWGSMACAIEGMMGHKESIDIRLRKYQIKD